MGMGRMLGARSDSLLSRPESTKRVLENDSGDIAFALALRLDTIFTGWALLATLDATLATCCQI